jgi:uncharacterized spore protein YtfJ
VPCAPVDGLRGGPGHPFNSDGVDGIANVVLEVIRFNSMVFGCGAGGEALRVESFDMVFGGGESAGLMLVGVS